MQIIMQLLAPALWTAVSLLLVYQLLLLDLVLTRLGGGRQKGGGTFQEQKCHKVMLYLHHICFLKNHYSTLLLEIEFSGPFHVLKVW